MTEYTPKTLASRRKAASDYQKRRVQAGERKVTFWTTTEVRMDLDRLKTKHGSTDAAIAAALRLAASKI